VIGACTIVAPAARAASTKLARVVEHPGLLHHALNSAVQRAPLRREVVLELDQHNGGALGIDGHSRLLSKGKLRPTVTLAPAEPRQ